MKRADHLPSLYKEGIYDDNAQNVMQFVMILNPTENPKVYQDAHDIIKQKYGPAFISEISMTSGGD